MDAGLAFLAGMLLALGCFKLHLALLIGFFALVLSRKWKAIAGFAAEGALATGVSLAIRARLSRSYFMASAIVAVVAAWLVVRQRFRGFEPSLLRRDPDYHFDQLSPAHAGLGYSYFARTRGSRLGTPQPEHEQQTLADVGCGIGRLCRRALSLSRGSRAVSDSAFLGLLSCRSCVSVSDGSLRSFLPEQVHCLSGSSVVNGASELPVLPGCAANPIPTSGTNCDPQELCPRSDSGHSSSFPWRRIGSAESCRRI